MSKPAIDLGPPEADKGDIEKRSRWDRHPETLKPVVVGFGAKRVPHLEKLRLLKPHHMEAAEQFAYHVERASIGSRTIDYTAIRVFGRRSVGISDHQAHHLEQVTRAMSALGGGLMRRVVWDVVGQGMTLRAFCRSGPVPVTVDTCKGLLIGGLDILANVYGK